MQCNVMQDGEVLEAAEAARLLVHEVKEGLLRFEKVLLHLLCRFAVCLIATGWL